MLPKKARELRFWDSFCLNFFYKFANETDSIVWHQIENSDEHMLFITRKNLPKSFYPK